MCLSSCPTSTRGVVELQHWPNGVVVIHSTSFDARTRPVAAHRYSVDSGEGKCLRFIKITTCLCELSFVSTPRRWKLVGGNSRPTERAAIRVPSTTSHPLPVPISDYTSTIQRKNSRWPLFRWTKMRVRYNFQPGHAGLISVCFLRKELPPSTTRHIQEHRTQRLTSNSRKPLHTQEHN